MKWYFVVILASLCVAASSVRAQTVCIEGSCRRVVIVTAQQHAESLASTGSFAHCGRRGGGYEGIGFSSASPDDAVRRCCYWGQRRVCDVGTAWSPLRRGWVAVVRYE